MVFFMMLRGYYMTQIIGVYDTILSKYSVALWNTTILGHLFFHKPFRTLACAYTSQYYMAAFDDGTC